jgi:hypothetical protein
MTHETTPGGVVRSEDGIGTRRRRPVESTYGLPNHEDGIQSGNLTQGDSLEPVKPEDDNTDLTGPGDTHSNGMKGQA